MELLNFNSCELQHYYCISHNIIVVDCGALESPEFGDVNINETTFGSIANYSCQTGYVLNGTSERVCEEDGQWTDLMPQCTRKIKLK